MSPFPSVQKINMAFSIIKIGALHGTHSTRLPPHKPTKPRQTQYQDLQVTSGNKLQVTSFVIIIYFFDKVYVYICIYIYVYVFIDIYMITPAFKNVAI